MSAALSLEMLVALVTSRLESQMHVVKRAALAHLCVGRTRRLCWSHSCAARETKVTRMHLKGRTCGLTHFSLPHFDFFRTNSYMIIGEMSFLFSEYSSLRNSVFSRKSSTSSDVGKYIQCNVKFPFGRNGG